MSETSSEWNKIVKDDAAQVAPSAAATQGSTASSSGPSAAYAAPGQTLPELPRVIGRVPITGTPSKVIVELPQPYKGVSCAAVFHNVTFLPDPCHPKPHACRQFSTNARPLDDRRVEVELYDGDGSTITGMGWAESDFPGGQLETAWVPIQTPVVEIEIVTGRAITCGPCDPKNVVTESWG